MFNRSTFKDYASYPAHEDETLQQLVPAHDDAYIFDDATTRAILAGFEHNRRVLIQGYHGTGKSTHIEQVASQLNWPVMRINLDGHIGRIDLIGKDVISLQDGKQVTTFKPGVIPWAMEHGVALILDEYDAARADVLFVLQRILEQDGALTLTDQHRVIQPHPQFRLFATANTIGLGDASGLYHGTNPINQGQMDRWNMVVELNYVPEAHEVHIVQAKFPTLDKEEAVRFVQLANLVREAFMQQSISTVMSPRTVLNMAENISILENREQAFRVSFLNKCDPTERSIIASLYQRVFGEEIAEFAAKTA